MNAAESSASTLPPPPSRPMIPPPVGLALVDQALRVSNAEFLLKFALEDVALLRRTLRDTRDVLAFMGTTGPAEVAARAKEAILAVERALLRTESSGV